jgi:isochorismate synthase EntC
VSLSGSRVETAAVAGTAARGRNPEEDRRLADALRESKKEQAEHEVVLRSVREALDGLCELSGPEGPELLRLEGLQHLHTPLAGSLRRSARGAHVLELAGRLHPSPAVGGAPLAPALSWIERHEGMDRGWYAGPVGFVDATGGGELHVALRSALVQGGEARLYAGAGIVAGSAPEAELRETRLKLRAVLAPLTEI